MLLYDSNTGERGRKPPVVDSQTPRGAFAPRSPVYLKWTQADLSLLTSFFDHFFEPVGFLRGQRERLAIQEVKRDTGALEAVPGYMVGIDLQPVFIGAKRNKVFHYGTPQMRKDGLFGASGGRKPPVGFICQPRGAFAPRSPGQMLSSSEYFFP